MGTSSIFDQGSLAFATEILVFLFSVEILNVISVKQIPPERFRWEGKIRGRFNRGTRSEKPFIFRCEFTKNNWNCKITQKSSIASGLYVLLFIETCLNKQCRMWTGVFFLLFYHLYYFLSLCTGLNCCTTSFKSFFFLLYLQK